MMNGRARSSKTDKSRCSKNFRNCFNRGWQNSWKLNLSKYEKDTVELVLKWRHGKYGNDNHYSILITWNYYEVLRTIEADSWSLIHYYVHKHFIVYCLKHCTKITENLGCFGCTAVTVARLHIEMVGSARGGVSSLLGSRSGFPVNLTTLLILSMRSFSYNTNVDFILFHLFPAVGKAGGGAAGGGASFLL